MRSTNAGHHGPTLALLLLGLSLSSGCASNHGFDREAEPDVAGLVSALEAQDEDEDSLFEGFYLPLLHLDMQLFTESDEEGYPPGHVLLSMRSWLPLFGIVDGDFTLYDEDRAAYEKGEFSWLLWGLWSRRSSTVQTSHGERTQRDYGLLWILEWEPQVEYGAYAERS